MSPFVLVALLLLAIWTGTFARIDQEEKIELNNIQVNNGNVARIIATDLDEVLGMANSYADMATAIAKGKREGIVNFNPAFFSDRAFLRLTVFDAKGRLLFSTAHNTQEPLLSAMLSEVSKSPGKNRALIVGHPDIHDGGAWRVPVLLPLGEAAQLGYLGGHLDLGYFLRLYGLYKISTTAGWKSEHALA